jgi:hypothetical protein
MVYSFSLREQIDRCRRLAHEVSDPVTRERLEKLAAEYEALAYAQGDEAAEAPGADAD